MADVNQGNGNGNPVAGGLGLNQGNQGNVMQQQQVVTIQLSRMLWLNLLNKFWPTQI
jgi:hypothetical protein